MLQRHFKLGTSTNSPLFFELHAHTLISTRGPELAEAVLGDVGPTDGLTVATRPLRHLVAGKFVLRANARGEEGRGRADFGGDANARL